jgi:hypothetical protein
MLLIFLNTYRFKQLTPEERLTSLTNIYPHMAEIFINMQSRRDHYGHEIDFALRGNSNSDRQASHFAHIFHQQTYSQAYSTMYNSSFDENVYCWQMSEQE